MGERRTITYQVLATQMLLMFGHLQIQILLLAENQRDGALPKQDSAGFYQDHRAIVSYHIRGSG